MANTQQYLVEYVVNANVSAAQQSLAALTAQMEQLQAQSVAPMRALGTSLDRLIKAQKNFGTRMGQAFDMTKPISQMTAFQNALLSTFKNAHVAMQGLFGNDIRMISAGLTGLAEKGFKSERALTGMVKGASMSAKETASQFKQLQNVTKAEQAELNKLANMYQRLGMAKRGSGAKSKWSAAALKTFNEDEQKYLDKISKRWATSNPDTVLGHIQDAIKKRTASLGAAKKAEEDFLAKYGSKDKGAGVAAASTMATAPIMMSAKEMNEKVRATRNMVKSFRKIIDDNKGKPKTIKYSVIVDDSEALGKLASLKTKFEELQRLANISVRVKGGTAANSFRKSIGQINDSVQSLKSTLDTAVTGTATQVAKAKKAPRSRSRVTLVPDKAGFQKSMSKLTGIKAVVDLILNANAIAKLKERVSKIKGLVANVMLKPDIVKLKESVAKIKGLKATVTLTPNISELKAKLRGIKGLTAPITAAAPGTTGTTTASGSKAGAGTTTNQPARRGGHPQGHREMQGTSRQMMRASTYPLVGNTSFGVQTPAFVGMAKGMVGMMGIGAAFGLIGDAMRQAVDYQNTMTSVKAILESNKKLTGYTPSNFAQMARNVRQVGMDTKFTAPEVAGAARFMAMAGLGVREINNSIRPIADVALIGDNELEMTADKLTNIQTAFGIGKDPKAMRKLADNLTTTFTRFNTDMMMTAEAMQYAAPVASAAGLGLEDTLAMIGVMGNAGIQSSMAGTTLRMALQNIINPNKKQKAMWDKLGISRFNSDGSVRNMIDILGDLSTKADDKTLIQLVSKMFRVTSMAGVTQIIRNLDKVRSTRDDMLLGRDTGISSRLSAEKQNTVAGLWAQVTSAFTEDNVKMFERFQSALKGMLVDIRDYLRGPEAIDNLNNIVELIKTMGWAFGQVARFWMGLYNAIPGVVKGMMVIQLFMSQLGMLLNPIVGLYRTLRNTGIGMGIIGAGGAAGMAGMAGMSAATAARFTSRYGRGALFGRAFSMARASGSLSLAGIGGSVMSGAGTLLGTLLSPISLTLAGIAGAVYMIVKYCRTKEKFDKLADNSRRMMQPQINKLANGEVNSEYFDTFNKHVRPHIAGYGQSETSVMDRVLGITRSGRTRKYTKVPTLHGLDSSQLLFTELGFMESQNMLMDKLSSTYIDPIKNDPILSGILNPFITKAYNNRHNINPLRGRRQLSAIASIIREGGSSKYVDNYRGQIVSLLTSAMFSKDPKAMEKAVERARGLIRSFKQMGLQYSTLDANTASLEAMRDHSPMRFSQYWEAGAAMLEGLLNGKDGKYLRGASAIAAHRGLFDTKSPDYIGTINERAKRGIGVPSFVFDAIVGEWFKNFDNIASSIGVYFDEKIGEITLDFKNGVPQFETLQRKIEELGGTFKDSIDVRIEMLRGISDSLNNIQGMDDVIQKIQTTIDQLNTIKHLGFNEFMKQYYNLDLTGMLHGAFEGVPFKKAEDTQVPLKPSDNQYVFGWNSGKKDDKFGTPLIFDPVAKMNNKLEKANSASSTVKPTTVKTGGDNGIRNPKTTNQYTPDTDAYKNHYQRSSARPTQIIFNIDNLVNFDKNEFLSADEKQIADQIMPRVVHAVTQAFATAQMQAGALVNTSGADMG